MKSTPQDLNGQQVQKVLRADLANLLKRVTSGTPLTRYQRQLLEEQAGQAAGQPFVTFAKSAVQIADILGVKRQTVHRWMKLPGNPGRTSNGSYSVSAWREFAKLRGHDVDDDGDTLNQTALKASQILLQNQKLEFQLGVLRRDYIPKAVARRVFSQLILEAKSRCFTGIPRLVTLARVSPDTAQASAEVHKEMTLIWQSLTDSKWFTPESREYARRRKATILQPTTQP